MMDDSFFGRSVANFPPYNIVKTGENTYDVELALAGFNKKDIEVEYKENLLTVKSKKQEETKDDTQRHLKENVLKEFYHCK
jgi:molecular chaperone IbpA